MSAEVIYRNGPRSSSPPKDNGIHHRNFSRESEKVERENLVLWFSPVTTCYYFLLELIHKFKLGLVRVLRYRKLVSTAVILGLLIFFADQFPGPHSRLMNFFKRKIAWWLWWIGLGFLSSCGFGTGLHTFVLYLGPFIAEVTMAAFECGTLDFPSPPYPEKVICPDKVLSRQRPTFLQLIRKTDLEAVLWGLGTAIGELPPYFMARSARLSGHVDEEDEELQEFEQMVDSVEAKQGHWNDMSLKERTEYLLHKLIQRAGFLGILLCASIPNPLFDLAGMTCGHFLVPFWHFFGATFIGKAIVKVHIQQIVIILLCSDSYMKGILEFIASLPKIGRMLSNGVEAAITKQKRKLHNKVVDVDAGWLSYGISLVVFGLMTAFLVSIVHAFAKDYHRRLCKWRHHADGELLDISKRD